MRYYYGQGTTVVYEDAKLDNHRWLIPPAGGAIQKGSRHNWNFQNQLDQTTTVYIYDVGGVKTPEPLPCPALTIVLSSPDPTHYHEWLKGKQSPPVYMPSWSEDEVTAVVPKVYPQKLKPDGASVYLERFKLYGGIARTIFSHFTDEKLEAELMKLIASVNLPSLYLSIQSGRRIESIKLLQYVLATNSDGSMNYREEPTIDFASRKICELVMDQVGERGQNEIISFLSSAIGKPVVAGIRGSVFERYAFDILTAGGIFKHRWEANLVDHTIRFPPAERKGIKQDLTALVDGEFAVPVKETYPTIDAAELPNHLFQMTVSPTHSINLAGLTKAMTDIGIGQPGKPTDCILHFVVPPDIYPKYHHIDLAVKPSPGSVLPNNVHLSVLEIPLPNGTSMSETTPMDTSTTTPISSLAAAASVVSAKAAKRKAEYDAADVPLPKKVATHLYL